MITSITAQGTLLQVKIPSEKPPQGGKRGKIKREVTSSVRKRMFDLFHRLIITRFIFITLTYGQKYPEPKLAKHHLKLFIMRLKYRYPDIAGVWRFELQKRQAPHFHLLMTHLPYIKKEKITEIWESVIGVEYRNNKRTYFGGKRKKTFTRIEMCRSKKSVFGYLAKYVAKKADVVKVITSHRRLLTAGRVEILPRDSVASGFNSIAYEQNFGKHWGIIGEEHLPYAPVKVIFFDGNLSVYHHFRRSCRTYYRKMKVFRAEQGLTLFCNDAYQWVDYFEKLFLSLSYRPKANCFGVIG